MMKDSTISKLFFRKTSKSPHRKAIGWVDGNDLNFYNNDEYQQKVRQFFYGLIKLDTQPQDRVAILAQTSKEWHFFDLATMCARAVVTPVYPTYLAHEVEYILNHSETKILILENEAQMQKILEIQHNLTHLKYIVALKEVTEDSVKKLSDKITFQSFQQFLDNGTTESQNSPKLFEATIEASEPLDIASIIYTSGTTGEPKGAVISQRAFVVMLNNVYTSLKTNILPTDRTLTFLPLSHVFGRCDSLLNLVFEFECVFAESLDKVVDNLQVAKPTLLLAVPRIFEKVYSKVLENIQKENDLKKKVFDWALKASNDYFEKINQDKSPSTYEILQKNLAYKLVFEKIYNRLGGRIRFLVSGGAPISPEIIRFMQNANLTILEGYGLTETVAPCILNPPVRQIPGTIGLPLGDVQVKFAEDGEIMVKTEAMLTEYYKNKEATKEAIKDGWLYTGDIGELTVEGYVKITDRKKDIIITSAGKNVAPQKIENTLKLQKHISNAMVVGDQRKFLVAIISIDHEAFRDDGVSGRTYEELAEDSKVYEIVDQEIHTVNKELASFESIKGFFIAPSDFTVENGQITPSLKLKKKVILKTYAKEIDALYKKLES
ncbi:long-chain fatty acid--CoA ligase [Bacteriovorax stolpii]|uniref:Long-chain fatty acid--CoA ligase n=1 Tax=Bacteriovorax stolpii TaxID=960 RepID=A0A2K9NMC7_BACTC|nr:long-chain fatty acid--CoA ligase [Bacteriovorax stolpii]AUN96663.1 long-chain fatty acid--CoA ligase [Bacteriovorax stolpii]TDP53816.1 long-chain acyl-CoA synthetase [Bacteriovorax stolpii]